MTKRLKVSDNITVLVVTSNGSQIRFVSAPVSTDNGQGQVRQVYATQQPNGTTTYELNGQTFQLVPAPQNRIVIGGQNPTREFVTLQVFIVHLVAKINPLIIEESSLKNLF